MKNFFKTNYVLLIILLLALFFRFWQIGHLPGGLFPDEAANGLDINTMFHGQIQPFYERGNGREALFFYFEAIPVLLFGRGVWQFHIVSAAFGFASVVALYFLAKRLFEKRVALLTTFFIAVSSYPVLVTRTAFRATTVPFFSIMTILFLVKFLQTENKKSRYISASLAGLFFALGFYTYTSFRMMLPLIVGFAVLYLLANRGRIFQIIKEKKGFTTAFIVAFLIGISWIAIWFLRHPGDFVGRAGEVSIFNKDLNNGNTLGTFVLVVKKTLLSFFTSGDMNWRQNVSGFPFLSIFLSPFFGVVWILFTISGLRIVKQIWNKTVDQKIWYQGFVACWLWFMMIPEVTTAEGIPHGLRIIGVIPPMFMMAAVGVNWLWEKLKIFPSLAKTKYYLAGIFIASFLVYNFNLYFVVAANSPDYYYAFRSDLTTVSNYLNQRNDKSDTYLSLDDFSVQTVDYLTAGYNNPYVLLDPASTYEVSLKKGDQVVFTMSTIFDRKKFLEFHPQATLVKQESNQFGQIIMLVYQQL